MSSKALTTPSAGRRGRQFFYVDERRSQFLRHRRHKETDRRRGDEKRSYSKASFEDRFGDDLCELILSYLPMEDKIVLQWTCPQWRRLIFTGLRDVSTLPFISRHLSSSIAHASPTQYFDSYGPWKPPVLEAADLFALVPVLTNASNVRSFRFLYGIQNLDDVFKAIIKFCHHMQDIESDFGISDEVLDKFLSKFGPKMKKILFTNVLEKSRFVEILGSCPALEAVGRNYFPIDILFDGDELLTNKLTKFRVESTRYQEVDHKADEMVRRVLQNNAKTMRRLSMMGSLDKYHNEVLAMNRLVRLSAVAAGDQLLNDFLNQLPKCCPKLVKFQVYIDQKVSTDMKEIFKAIDRITGLKAFKLQVDSIDDIPNYPLVCKAFKNCNKLTSLKVIGRTISIEDDFFVSIDECLPNLQKVYLQCQAVTGVATQWLARLPYLRFLLLGSNMGAHYLDQMFGNYGSPSEKRDHLKDEDVFELIRKSRKLSRVFITTPSPNYLTCDLYDCDIKMMREENQLDVNTLFVDDGEQFAFENCYAKRADEYDPKVAITSFNWNR